MKLEQDEDLSRMMLEDFSTWDVEDPDNRLSVERNRVSWVHADRTRLRYVAKDHGKETIGDFMHEFAVRISDAWTPGGVHTGLLRFWECRNDWGNRIWIYARKTVEDTDKWAIHFEQAKQKRGLWIFNGSHQFDMKSACYVRLDRHGELCRLRVYSDPTWTHLVEDSGDIIGAKDRYRYLRICFSGIRERYNRSNWSTGYIENLQVTQK